LSTTQPSAQILNSLSGLLLGQQIVMLLPFPLPLGIWNSLAIASAAPAQIRSRCSAMFDLPLMTATSICLWLHQFDTESLIAWANPGPLTSICHIGPADEIFETPLFAMKWFWNSTKLPKKLRIEYCLFLLLEPYLSRCVHLHELALEGFAGLLVCSH